MFSRYSLKNQFIAVFIITFLMATLLATFIINRLHTLADLNAATYQHPFTVSNAVRDVHINITSMHRYMKDVALAENTEKMELAITKVNAAENNVYQNFNLIKERFLGNQSMVDNAISAVDDWVVIRNEVISLMRSHQKIAAADITRNKGAQHVVLIEERMQDLLDFANAKAREFSQQSHEMAETILTTTILILTLFFFLGALVIYNLYRELLNQVASLSNSTHIISNGNYKAPVPDLGDNEIGLLAKNFEHMRQSILNSTSQINDAKEMAVHANASKSRFLTNMSHEFRTPMHGILSFSQLGLTKTNKEDHSKCEKYFEHISNSADRLMGLLNRLFELSQFEAGKVELKPLRANLSDVVKQQIESLREDTESKGVEISCELETHATARFDPVSIGQVIMHLFNNAIKYSPPNSTIIIECGKLDTPKNKLNFDIESHLTFPAIYLSIKDKGPGIPQHELVEIFHPFVQSSKTDNEDGGTGLGLAISKEIIELHGGIIWAESEENSGSTFSFIIPVQSISADTEANKEISENIH